MSTEVMQGSRASETDISTLFGIFWKYRTLLVFGNVIMIILAVVISYFIPRVYRSEGYYQLGFSKNVFVQDYPRREEAASVMEDVKSEDFFGVPIPFFKSIFAYIANPNRFQLIASKQKTFTAKNLNDIRKKMRTESSIKRWINPVYASSKEDDSKFFNPDKKDRINSVIGLRLSYEAGSPQEARNYVWFFGNYIRDCLLRVMLHNYIMGKSFSCKSDLNLIENDLIRTDFELVQDKKRLQETEAILSKYPNSARIDNWQLASIAGGGARFLSPLTQLVGIESSLVERRQGRFLLERKKEMRLLDLEYYLRCKEELLDVNASGEALFTRVKVIKREVFKNKDFRKDTVREVYNRLMTELQTYDLVFFTNFHFISGPIMPVVRTGPKRVMIVIGTFLFSLVFFMFVALFLNWWQGHKKQILASNPKS